MIRHVSQPMAIPTSDRKGGAHDKQQDDVGGDLGAATAAATAAWKMTMAAASLKRPSLCSTCDQPPRHVDAAGNRLDGHGSGGATMAPSAMAAGMPMPGIMSHAAPATTAVEITTSATASMISVRQRTRNTAQELRWAVAKSSGGRKMGRISSGGICHVRETRDESQRHGQQQHQHGVGQPSRSPRPTATTVASSSPTMSANWSMCLLSPRVRPRASRLEARTVPPLPYRDGRAGLPPLRRR